MKGQKIGYARVSTLEQNEEYQVNLLKEYECDRIFIDKSTGRNTDRENFKNMMNYIREGDELYIVSFSRLSRNLRDLLKIVEELKEKNIRIVCIKENIDTNTPSGMMMMQMLGIVYQFEVDNLKERQRMGIENMKREGKKFAGRRKIEKPDNWKEIYEQWKSRELKTKYALEILSIKKDTFYKWIKEEEKLSIM